ncbi:hypothetical protein C6341_g21252 [Phytophthora cactorum]|nr:hypothetical protein C6341_g21252 [Phytophthora cactorum]
MIKRDSVLRLVSKEEGCRHLVNSPTNTDIVEGPATVS